MTKSVENTSDAEGVSACEEGGQCKSPKSITGLFKSYAGCSCSAVGGAALSHVGCVLVPVFAGVASAAIHTAMFVASPVLAAGITLGLGKWRGEDVISRRSIKKAGVSATIALAVTFGISALTGHEHHDHTPEQAMEWFETLPEKDRQRIAEIANDAEVSTEDYILELKGIDALTAEEETRLRNVVGEQCPCTVPGACKVPGLTP